jgi:hypothetical protein
MVAGRSAQAFLPQGEGNTLLSVVMVFRSVGACDGADPIHPMM